MASLIFRTVPWSVSGPWRNLYYNWILLQDQADRSLEKVLENFLKSQFRKYKNAGMTNSVVGKYKLKIDAKINSQDKLEQLEFKAKEWKR